jgi:hypothetical protein
MRYGAQFRIKTAVPGCALIFRIRSIQVHTPHDIPIGSSPHINARREQEAVDHDPRHCDVHDGREQKGVRLPARLRLFREKRNRPGRPYHLLGSLSVAACTYAILIVPPATQRKITFADAPTTNSHDTNEADGQGRCDAMPMRAITRWTRRPPVPPDTLGQGQRLLLLWTGACLNAV